MLNMCDIDNDDTQQYTRLECLKQAGPEETNTMIIDTEMEYIQKYHGDGVHDDNKEKKEEKCYIHNMTDSCLKTFTTNDVIEQAYMTTETQIYTTAVEENPQDDAYEDVGISEEIIHDCIQKQQRCESMLTMNVPCIEIKATGASKDKKLVDSGANRNLTRYRQILKNYRRIRKIPVYGIGPNGAACFIEGVGTIDVYTEEGEIIQTKMYHAPDCSSTIFSPNAFVNGSDNRFTSWTQTSHVVDGMSTITFFNKEHSTHKNATISMELKYNLWFINQNYKRSIHSANPRAIFSGEFFCTQGVRCTHFCVHAHNCFSS